MIDIMDLLLAGSVAANIVIGWYAYKATLVVADLERVLMGVASGLYQVKTTVMDTEEESGD